jgi:redox-sensing transcriptional repressor
MAPTGPRLLADPTVARLPIYQRITQEWIRRGRARIDSPTLGRLAGVAPATVRRDLSGLGPVGTRGSGYDTATLNQCLESALGHDETFDVIVIGAGNLGRALVSSSTFLSSGASLVGLYDVSPAVVGTIVNGRPVEHFADELAPASLAVLCVPAEDAQGAADRLVDHEIRAILNFAPQVISVPAGVAVRYVDFSIELEILHYQLTHHTGPLAGGVLHALGISRPSPRASEAS